MNFNKAFPVLTACVFLNFMKLFWQSFVAVKMKAWMHAYLKSGGGGKRRIKRRKENNQFGIKFIPKTKSAFFSDCERRHAGRSKVKQRGDSIV